MPERLAIIKSSFERVYQTVIGPLLQLPIAPVTALALISCFLLRILAIKARLALTGREIREKTQVLDGMRGYFSFSIVTATSAIADNRTLLHSTFATKPLSMR